MLNSFKAPRGWEYGGSNLHVFPAPKLTNQTTSNTTSPPRRCGKIQVLQCFFWGHFLFQRLASIEKLKISRDHSHTVSKIIINNISVKTFGHICPDLIRCPGFSVNGVHRLYSFLGHLSILPIRFEGSKGCGTNIIQTSFQNTF